MGDPTDALKAFENVIGLEVKITNTFDSEYIGTIYTYTTTPSTLVLQIPTQSITGDAYNYLFFRTSHIKSLDILSKKIDYGKIAKIVKVDTSQIEKIVKRNTETAQLLTKTQNSKATPEGQLLFNSVYKTIPNVRWSGASIIVLDEVSINHPYTVDSIKSIKKDGESSDAIDLVRKVVDGVWLKIDNQRKGG